MCIRDRLVAPPSADLRAFAAFADERDITVLLPYQRGHSLDTLRGLEGRERLWPLVPSRQEDLKAMVAAAMEAGWGRALMQLGCWPWPMQHPCRCLLTGASMRWVGWTLNRRRSFRFARPLSSVAAGSVCV